MDAKAEADTVLQADGSYMAETNKAKRVKQIEHAREVQSEKKTERRIRRKAAACSSTDIYFDGEEHVWGDPEIEK